MYHIGLDIGSTTIKCVVLDEQQNLQMCIRDRPKMKQHKKFLTKECLAYFLLLNAGLILLAAGIHFFKSPNHFAMGGTCLLYTSWPKAAFWVR